MSLFSRSTVCLICVFRLGIRRACGGCPLLSGPGVLECTRALGECLAPPRGAGKDFPAIVDSDRCGFSPLAKQKCARHCLAATKGTAASRALSCIVRGHQFGATAERGRRVAGCDRERDGIAAGDVPGDSPSRSGDRAGTKGRTVETRRCRRALCRAETVLPGRDNVKVGRRCRSGRLRARGGRDQIVQHNGRCDGCGGFEEAAT